MEWARKDIMAKFAKNDWIVRVSHTGGLRVPVALHLGARVEFEAAELPKSVRGRKGFRIFDRGRPLPVSIAACLAATLGDVQTHAGGQLSLPA